MIFERTILNKFIDFTRAAAPILHLTTAEAYEDAMQMIEHLMEAVNDDPTRPENLLITLLAQAIERYELSQDTTVEFLNTALNGKNDVAILRFIIDQHQLRLSDLPEIGHKSLVSKILAGQRKLTRSHIDKLSQRFDLSPALFF